MPKTTPTCAYRSEPARFLCDHRGDDGSTCDRPLCGQHASRQGTIFFDGAKSGVDTIDYCPHHAGQFLKVVRA